MRKLNKVNKLSIEELIEYIIKEFHKPLRNDLQILEKYIYKIGESLEYKNKMLLPKEIFKQFNTELISHIDHEESDFFPKIIKLERWTLKDKSNSKKFLHIQEVEHNEIDNYLIWLKNIINNLTDNKSEDYIKLKDILDKIYDDTLDHVYIENNYLNTKVNKLIKN